MNGGDPLVQAAVERLAAMSRRRWLKNSALSAAALALQGTPLRAQDPASSQDQADRKSVV